METPPGSAPTQPPTDTTPRIRLVIRAEIIPEDEPQPPARPQLNKRAIALALVIVAVLALLGWIGVRALRTDPASAPIASKAVSGSRSQASVPMPAPAEVAPGIGGEPPATPPASTAKAGPAAAASVESGSPRAKSVESTARENADASPSAMHEVIPDVPQSARQTIRGTVKVTVQVTVDRQGMVLAATPADPGPSPYFARLALEASRKWTFAPADTNEQRLMRVRFNFTRAGTTAVLMPGTQ